MRCRSKRRSRARPHSSRERRSHRGTFALLSVVVPVVLAACGGGSASPGVASLGSTTTTTISGGTASATKAVDYADSVKYAACMRQHGIANFPDPQPNGGFRFGPGTHMQQGSTQFKAADKTCSHLLPNGGVMTPAEQAQALAQLLKFSACMRAHGIPNFPDPVARDGGISLSLGPTGLRPGSPVLQKAQRACANLSPFGGN